MAVVNSINAQRVQAYIGELKKSGNPANVTRAVELEATFLLDPNRAYNEIFGGVSSSRITSSRAAFLAGIKPTAPGGAPSPIDTLCARVDGLTNPWGIYQAGGAPHVEIMNMATAVARAAGEKR